MAVTRPLCEAMASRPECVLEAGRVAADGTIVAPRMGPAFKVTALGSGVYTIKFTNPYAELLSAQITFEGTALTALPEPEVDWVQATSTLTVTFVLSAGGAAGNTRFNFLCLFADSVVP